MHIKAATLDDLLRKATKHVLSKGIYNVATRGANREQFGVLLELTNPLARLSRTESRGQLFSCLGEFLWYASASDSLEFIKYYIKRYAKESSDKRTIYGAYGPRIFRWRDINQVENVVQLLQRKPTTRQAVIQIFDAEDINSDNVKPPCTCSIQLSLRGQQLDAMATMRSNDVLLGLPHDVFAFTMFQELVARKLGAQLGVYKHSVGSLHLYDEDIDKAKEFLREGWQSNVPMPSMPQGDNCQQVRKTLKAEALIRKSGGVPDTGTLSDYWKDIVTLLRIFKAYKTKQADSISTLKDQITSNVFNTYIERKLPQPPTAIVQPSLDFSGSSSGSEN